MRAATVEERRAWGIRSTHLIRRDCQATDDLLDAVGSEKETGKSVGTDVMNGRQTFLTLAYPSTDHLAAIRSMVDSCTAGALHALNTLPESPARERLAELALALLERRQ